MPGENRPSYINASWLLWTNSSRPGLAIKEFIDVGAGVIDSDYRGEIGVVLFNFSEEEFCINMGDRIAQIIFEKIKTPSVKETNELGDTDRGNKGYGSSGISAREDEKLSKSKDDAVAKVNQDFKINTVNKSEAKIN